MKNIKKILRNTLITLACSALTAAVYAHPGPGKDRKGPPEHSLGSRGGIKHELRELNLTPQQREQIQTLMQQAREAHTPKRDAIAAERRKLREIINTDPVNPGAIRAQTMRIAELEAELNTLRAQERVKVEAVLTPEQRAKMKEIRARNEERMENEMRERIRKRWQESAN